MTRKGKTVYPYTELTGGRSSWHRILPDIEDRSGSTATWPSSNSTARVTTSARTTAILRACDKTAAKALRDTNRVSDSALDELEPLQDTRIDERKAQEEEFNRIRGLRLAAQEAKDRGAIEEQVQLEKEIPLFRGR